MKTCSVATMAAVALLVSVVTAQEPKPTSTVRFMIEAKYADPSWAAMSERPQDRRQLLQAVVEELGGTVEHLWFSFGEYDAYVIVTLPDNVTAEALQIAGHAGGGFKVLKTTPLLSVAEAMTAMEKAGTIRANAAYKKAHGALKK